MAGSGITEVLFRFTGDPASALAAMGEVKTGLSELGDKAERTHAGLVGAMTLVGGAAIFGGGVAAIHEIVSATEEEQAAVAHLNTATKDAGQQWTPQLTDAFSKAKEQMVQWGHTESSTTEAMAQLVQGGFSLQDSLKYLNVISDLSIAKFGGDLPQAVHTFILAIQGNGRAIKDLNLQTVDKLATDDKLAKDQDKLAAAQDKVRRLTEDLAHGTTVQTAAVHDFLPAQDAVTRAQIAYNAAVARAQAQGEDPAHTKSVVDAALSLRDAKARLADAERAAGDAASKTSAAQSKAADEQKRRHEDLAKAQKDASDAQAQVTKDQADLADRTRNAPIVADELSKKLGGASQAASQTLGGALREMEARIHGAAAAAGEKLTPKLVEIAHWADQHQDDFRRLFETIATVGAAAFGDLEDIFHAIYDVATWGPVKDTLEATFTATKDTVQFLSDHKAEIAVIAGLIAGMWAADKVAGWGKSVRDEFTKIHNSGELTALHEKLQKLFPNLFGKPPDKTTENPPIETAGTELQKAATQLIEAATALKEAVGLQKEGAAFDEGVFNRPGMQVPGESGGTPPVSGSEEVADMTVQVMRVAELFGGMFEPGPVSETTAAETTTAQTTAADEVVSAEGRAATATDGMASAESRATTATAEMAGAAGDASGIIAGFTARIEAHAAALERLQGSLGSAGPPPITEEPVAAAPTTLENDPAVAQFREAAAMQQTAATSLEEAAAELTRGAIALLDAAGVGAAAEAGGARAETIAADAEAAAAERLGLSGGLGVGGKAATAAEDTAAIKTATRNATSEGVVEGESMPAVVEARKGSGATMAKEFGTKLGELGLGAMIAMPFISMVNDWAKGHFGIDMFSGDTWRDVGGHLQQGLTGYYGGAPGTEAIGRMIYEVQAGGWNPFSADAKTAAVNALGSQEMVTAVTAGDSAGIEQISALTQSYGWTDVAKKYHDLAELVKEGKVRTAQGLNEFTAANDDYATFMATNLKTSFEYPITQLLNAVRDTISAGRAPTQQSLDAVQQAIDQARGPLGAQGKAFLDAQQAALDASKQLLSVWMGVQDAVGAISQALDAGKAPTEEALAKAQAAVKSAEGQQGLSLIQQLTLAEDRVLLATAEAVVYNAETVAAYTRAMSVYAANVAATPNVEHQMPGFGGTGGRHYQSGGWIDETQPAVLHGGEIVANPPQMHGMVALGVAIARAVSGDDIPPSVAQHIAALLPEQRAGLASMGLTPDAAGAHRVGAAPAGLPAAGGLLTMLTRVLPRAAATERAIEAGLTAQTTVPPAGQPVAPGAARAGASGAAVHGAPPGRTQPPELVALGLGAAALVHGAPLATALNLTGAVLREHTSSSTSSQSAEFVTRLSHVLGFGAPPTGTPSSPMLRSSADGAWVTAPEELHRLHRGEMVSNERQTVGTFAAGVAAGKSAMGGTPPSGLLGLLDALLPAQRSGLASMGLTPDEHGAAAVGIRPEPQGAVSAALAKLQAFNAAQREQGMPISVGTIQPSTPPMASSQSSGPAGNTLQVGDVHLHNPSSEIDAIRMLDRQLYLMQSAARGVRPAYDWPGWLADERTHERA